ncbi:hypothetical protein llap_13861 [Limosa lapponica baueri]|uniref:Uncharacterized protein n=1 Tax=Limosa lapponica baueri TaxID=1758121 RepID=A0A2I0TPU5_LIMLA|nr:hypothetical protein llap_13861 [Limosa lapponica baueri]
MLPEGRRTVAWLPPAPLPSKKDLPQPGLAPFVSPEETNMDDLLSTSAAGGPGGLPSAPVLIPREQEEPQEESKEAMACPSASSQGRERSPGESWQRPKRRAGSPEASSPAKKRPPCWQH